MRELAATNSLNRWELLRRPESGVYVTLVSRFVAGNDPGRISLIMGTRYTCLRHMIKHRLLEYNIEVAFDISTPDGTPFSATGADLHPRLMALMYSSAIGALRGMLALRVESTWLRHYPLPLVNISDLVSRHIYGTAPSEKTIPLVNFIYN